MPRQGKPLSEEQVRVLDCLRRNRHDKQAREDLLRINHGLILRAVNRFNHTRNHELDQDLKQQGAIGLLQALDGFDFTRGVRFSTYAYPYIEQSIRRYLETQECDTCMPVIIQEICLALQNAEDAFSRQCHTVPSADQMADFLDCDVSYIHTIRAYAAQRAIGSLDAPLEEENLRLADLVPDTESASPIHSLLGPQPDHPELSTEDMWQAIDTLPTRSRQVLLDYFCEGKNYVVIAKQLGLSKERVRQLVEHARKQVQLTLHLPPVPWDVPSRPESAPLSALPSIPAHAILSLIRGRLKELRHEVPPPAPLSLSAALLGTALHLLSHVGQERIRPLDIVALCRERGSRPVIYDKQIEILAGLRVLSRPRRNLYGWGKRVNVYLLKDAAHPVRVRPLPEQLPALTLPVNTTHDLTRLVAYAHKCGYPAST
jgi:RNA polymerase sigma factor (sigma-70 family)